MSGNLPYAPRTVNKKMSRIKNAKIFVLVFFWLTFKIFLKKIKNFLLLNYKIICEKSLDSNFTKGICGS